MIRIFQPADDGRWLSWFNPLGAFGDDHLTSYQAGRDFHLSRATPPGADFAPLDHTVRVQNENILLASLGNHRLFRNHQRFDIVLEQRNRQKHTGP